MRTPDQFAERFEDLTFEILFYKYMYFEYDHREVADSIYDSLKEEYHTIGRQLGYQLTSFSPCYGFSHGHPLATKVAKAVKEYLGFNL
jgi:NAD-dependent DNA ligase